jgi:hypothetical protein
VITQWVLGIGAGLLHGLFSVLPAITAPDWLTSNNGAFASVFADSASMGAWFNAPLLIVVLSGLLVLWLTGFTIKLARMVLSLFTAGGGSAA